MIEILTRCNSLSTCNAHTLQSFVSLFSLSRKKNHLKMMGNLASYLYQCAYSHFSWVHALKRCSHIRIFLSSSNFKASISVLWQVNGVVQNSGKPVATLFGKWDQSIHYCQDGCLGKDKGSASMSDAHLLWKRSKPSKCKTKYNLTRFAITLNELTPGLKVTQKIIVYIIIYSNL